MIFETTFFGKYVIKPHGSISIVMDKVAKSANVDAYSKIARVRVRHAARGADGEFMRADYWLSNADELCAREQAFILRAIREDLELSRHNEHAVPSLEIVLERDESVREMRAVDL